MSIALPASAQARRRPSGNAAACALLVLAAAALVALHDAPWWSAPPPVSRWWLAGATLLAYAAAARWSVVAARRRLRREAAADGAPPPRGSGAAAVETRPVLVAYASQTGTAQALARRSAERLRAGGDTVVQVLPLSALDDARLQRCSRLYVVASTTGEGDAPDAALGFAARLDHPASLPQLRHAVLALGDRRYAAFCAFGARIDAWLRAAGAVPMAALREVDNADPVALHAWFDALARDAIDPGFDGSLPRRRPGPAATPDPASTGHWSLSARRLANPGSLGAEAYAIALHPPVGVPVAWQAGDLVEITPRNPPDAVAAALAALRAPAALPVVDALGRSTRLDVLLASAALPALPTVAEVDVAAFARTLAPLRSRSYSIASLPADGAVELLVRRHHRADGRDGVGSGWLCRHLAEGAPVEARLRENAAFHAPDASRPLILVGNGTGAAGLRAHLRARVAAGARRQWLLLGERGAARDAFYGPEFEALLADGTLDALDRAWSRDGSGPRYVQDALAARATRLRAWIDDGASVHVCGSASGMAPGVDTVLRSVLGNDAVDALRREGRYRRDVY